MELSKDISKKTEEISELVFHLTISLLEGDYFYDKTIDEVEKSAKCLTIAGQALKCLSYNNSHIEIFHKKLTTLVNDKRVLLPKDKLVFDLMVNCNDKKSFELFNYADDQHQAIMLKHAFHILQLRSEPNKSFKCLGYLLNLNSNKKNLEQLPFLKMFTEFDVISKLRYHLHDFDNPFDIFSSNRRTSNWQNDIFHNIFHYFSKDDIFKKFVEKKFHKRKEHNVEIGMQEIIFCDLFQRKFDYNFTQEIVKNIISIPKLNIASRLQHLRLNGDKNLKSLGKFLNTDFNLNEHNVDDARDEIALSLLVNDQDFAFKLDDSVFNWLENYEDNSEISINFYYLWAINLNIERSDKYISHCWDNDFKATQSEFPAIFGQNNYSIDELFGFNKSNEFINHDYLENKLLYGNILNYKMDFKSLLLHPAIRTFGKLECCIFMLKSIFKYKKLYDDQSLESDEILIFEDYIE